MFLNVLSVIYEQTYLANWDLGDIETAKAAAMACLDVSKQWATVDATNSDALSRVASAYTIIGNAERRLNHLTEARDAYYLDLKSDNNSILTIRSIDPILLHRGYASVTCFGSRGITLGPSMQHNTLLILSKIWLRSSRRTCC
jgi:hypothetical protein